MGRIEDHPLRGDVRAGLLVTVNSDDPAYFGGYVDDNYRLIQGALGIDDGELARLAEASFQAAFLGEERRTGTSTSWRWRAGRRVRAAGNPRRRWRGVTAPPPARCRAG